MIMKKTKTILITSIISIFLMFSLCTICYAATIKVDVNGTEMELEYSSPSLDKDDIEDIEKQMEDFVEQKENQAEGELKQETLTEVKEKVEELIEEIEQEKIRESEKQALKEMEKEYRAEKNKIPKAGDITIKVLRTIIITLVIALIIVIAFSRKRKV